MRRTASYSTFKSVMHTRVIPFLSLLYQMQLLAEAADRLQVQHLFKKNTFLMLLTFKIKT